MNASFFFHEPVHRKKCHETDKFMRNARSKRPAFMLIRATPGLARGRVAAVKNRLNSRKAPELEDELSRAEASGRADGVIHRSTAARKGISAREIEIRLPNVDNHAMQSAREPRRVSLYSPFPPCEQRCSFVRKTDEAIRTRPMYHFECKYFKGVLLFPCAVT